MAKLVHLPTTKLTPKVMLHQLLQRVDELETMVIVYQTKDGFFATWTECSNAELCMSSKLLDAQVGQTLLEGS